MNKLITLMLGLACLASCSEKIEYASFGKEITEDGAVAVAELASDYENLAVGDSLEIKFEGTIDEVCQKKGCWMKVDLGEGEETFVRFKDYGFFVPLDAGKQKTVVSGKAFVTETSVEELKHYAKDAGKSEEEIAQITTPKKEYAFIADGVLVEKVQAVTE